MARWHERERAVKLTQRATCTTRKLCLFGDFDCAACQGVPATGLRKIFTFVPNVSTRGPVTRSMRGSVRDRTESEIDSEQGNRPARDTPTSITWPATGLRNIFTFFFDRIESRAILQVTMNNLSTSQLQFFEELSDRKRDGLGAGQSAGPRHSDIDYLAGHGT